MAQFEMEYYVFILLLSFCLFVTNAEHNPGCCGKGMDGSCTKCCTNYRMLNDTCRACPDGFWSHNCSRSCQYPYFGRSCLQKCHCDEHSCDGVKGCLDPITTQKPVVFRSTSHSPAKSRIVGQQSLSSYFTVKTSKEEEDILTLKAERKKYIQEAEYYRIKTMYLKLKMKEMKVGRDSEI